MLSVLINNGILDVLAATGFSTELEIQRESAAAICSLSLSAPHRTEVVEYYFYPHILGSFLL